MRGGEQQSKVEDRVVDERTEECDGKSKRGSLCGMEFVVGKHAENKNVDVILYLQL
jgi:hypothetical protein